MKDAGKNPVASLVVVIAAIVLAVGIANAILAFLSQIWPVILVIIAMVVIGVLSPRILLWLKGRGEFKP